MRKHVGNKDFDIWLLGDSPPNRWEDVLDTPLDPRHPARHSIWTPVLDVIQDTVFGARRGRIETAPIYIRNAIEDSADKPSSLTPAWQNSVERELLELQEMLRRYRPRMLLSFGAFAFEFARRALAEEPRRRHGHWGARRLGQQFRQRIARFDLDSINLLPLLHVSIARWKFIQSHDYFCAQRGANYFEFVGKNIARRLLEHRDDLRVWIE